MRIKWTSIPNVMTPRTPDASWTGSTPAEAPKPEAMAEREPEKKDKKKKSERAFAALRRNR